MFKSSMCHLYYHDLTSFLLKLEIICILCYASLCFIMVCLFINYRYVKHNAYSMKPVGMYNISMYCMWVLLYMHVKIIIIFI